MDDQGFRISNPGDISPESGPETEDHPDTTLINDIIVAFMEFAEGHYVGPDGTPSGEIINLREAVKPLRVLYGYTPADKFGPLGLRAVRDKMIDQGLSRTTINSRINRIRRVFRWAASVELVPGAVVQSLGTVAGLQKGRTKARESRGIRPVPVRARRGDPASHESPVVGPWSSSSSSPDAGRGRSWS